MDQEQLYSYLKKLDALNADTLGETKKLIIDFPWFTLGWLLYLKNLKNLDHPEYNAVLKKVAIMVPDRKELYRFLNNEQVRFQQIEARTNETGEYRLEGAVKLEVESSLIDKFLSANTKRSRGVNLDLQSSKEVARKVPLEQSMEDDDELITETLASIYFQQKNYDKALDAYKKLSLKYPEKSIYFAGRIKEIESLKNNNL